MTSEDTGTYGRDIGSSLPALLQAVVAELPDGVMLRLGMTNPPYILEHLEAMADVLSHPRVYSFLHIPVQVCVVVCVAVCVCVCVCVRGQVSIWWSRIS